MSGSSEHYLKFSLVWSLVIFLSIPMARKVQSVVQSTLGREAFRYGTVTLLILMVLSLFFLLHQKKILTGKKIVQITFLLLAGSLAVFYIAHSPEESFHFIEYGVLGWALYGYFSRSTRGIYLLLSVAAAGSIVGFSDEALQWVIPGRFFDYMDIFINIIGILLGGAMGSVILTQVDTTEIDEFSVRKRAYLLVMVFILLLTASFHNTPGHVKRYVHLFPVLDFLDNNPSVMCEYGYLHEDQGIKFFSRMTMDELVAQGNKKMTLSPDFYDNDLYKETLLKYSASESPFLHEGRVHLFRRSSYLAKLKDQPEDQAIKKIIAGEEYILRNYYTFLWKDRPVSGMLLVRHRVEYRSPVSSHLITWITYDAVVTLSAIIFFLSGIGFYLHAHRGTHV